MCNILLDNFVVCELLLHFLLFTGRGAITNEQHPNTREEEICNDDGQPKDDNDARLVVANAIIPDILERKTKVCSSRMCRTTTIRLPRKRRRRRGSDIPSHVKMMICTMSI
mmetsp:Transcript_10403/g.22020  ORF Transcript_10403/g.22020 Transcript_10403/m.22020 type:complete len:111 (+) Transcript_10403:122-454(+)